MFRGVGDNEALFSDEYMATQALVVPHMKDPPKRTITTNAVPSDSTPAPVVAATAPPPAATSAAVSPLVMYGLVGVVAVAGVYFFSRRNR